VEVEVQEVASPTNLLLNKVQFFNEQIGFIVGGSRFMEACFLKTTDGGATWTRVDLSFAPEKKAIYGIDISPTGKLITVGYGGTIFVSNDTGKTFQYVQHNSWREFQDVSIRSDDSCVIVGGIAFASGFVTRMKTNGEAANIMQEEWKAEMSDVNMLTDQVGYISGFGAVLKTINGGLTWDFTNAQNDYFKAMCWLNESEGVIVGYEGSIMKTFDAGKTWDVLRNGNSITKPKFHFLNMASNGKDAIVAVGEKGLVMVSENRGANWKQLKDFTKEDIRGVEFVNSTTYYVVGSNGSIFKLSLS
jgi:photosystem II stability/assembly factor-like uncharacterized protein